jgi:hypothetical protein
LLVIADRRFLRDVAAELERYEVLGPGVVSRLCASAQRKFFAAPTMRARRPYGPRLP